MAYLMKHSMILMQIGSPKFVLFLKLSSTRIKLNIIYYVGQVDILFFEWPMSAVWCEPQLYFAMKIIQSVFRCFAFFSTMNCLGYWLHGKSNSRKPIWATAELVYDWATSLGSLPFNVGRPFCLMDVSQWLHNLQPKRHKCCMHMPEQFL